MSVAFLIAEKLVKVLLRLLDNSFSVFLFLFGGIFERVTDSPSDHGFEFLLLLYFITVKSNYDKKKNTEFCSQFLFLSLPSSAVQSCPIKVCRHWDVPNEVFVGKDL